MTPLRRKPKQLQEEPTLFQPGTGGNGAVLRTDGSRAAAKAKPSTAISGVTDEVAELVLAEADAMDVNPMVRARIRQIAARLSIRRPRSDGTAQRGAGTLTSLLYRGGSDEIAMTRVDQQQQRAHSPHPPSTRLVHEQANAQVQRGGEPERERECGHG